MRVNSPSPVTKVFLLACWLWNSWILLGLLEWNQFLTPLSQHPMTAHPLAYSNYLRFSAIVRQREHFQDEELKELYARQTQEGFVDGKGSQWCLGSLIGKAWIEHRYESRSLANALETLETVNPGWATPKALAWLVAAVWDPKGDPLDPKSLHRTTVQDILEAKLKSLSRPLWLLAGQEAMGILSNVWEKGSTLDSPSRTADRHSDIWLKFSLSWSEGKEAWPFATHPDWPQWVADKTIQMLSSTQVSGIRPEDVEILLGLQGAPAAHTDSWVRAWMHVGRTHPPALSRAGQPSANHQHAADGGRPAAGRYGHVLPDGPRARPPRVSPLNFSRNPDGDLRQTGRVGSRSCSLYRAQPHG